MVWTASARYNLIMYFSLLYYIICFPTPWTQCSPCIPSILLWTAPVLPVFISHFHLFSSHFRISKHRKTHNVGLAGRERGGGVKSLFLTFPESSIFIKISFDSPRILILIYFHTNSPESWADIAKKGLPLKSAKVCSNIVHLGVISISY